MIDVNEVLTQELQELEPDVVKAELFFAPTPGLDGDNVQSLMLRTTWIDGEVVEGFAGRLEIPHGGIPISSYPFHLLAVAMENLGGALRGDRASNAAPAPPNVSTPIADRLEWWKLHGECGISSRTIAVAMTGDRNILGFGHGDHGPSVPLDPDDFRRCELLLGLIPEWNEELHLVAERFPEWDPLVREWNSLRDLYWEELPSGSAPKLAERMRVLIEHGRKRVAGVEKGAPFDP